MTSGSIVIETDRGSAILDDALVSLSSVGDDSVDLVVTSPPFALVLPKTYGNMPDSEYLDWFEPFADEIHRVLKDTGSFVVDLGGAWTPKLPVRSLYQFRLLLMPVDRCGFMLAQDFYWWQPSRLPTPAEWVTVRRIRVEDAVNTVWWLSKTPWPKAHNGRVRAPCSDAQLKRMEVGESQRRKPSGHVTTASLANDNGGAIPPNLLAFPNTASNDRYLTYCSTHNVAPHPARFPAALPEYFVRLLTDRGDLVLDPFAGSCTTGEVCERLDRRWLCIDKNEEYLRGAKGRFPEEGQGGLFDVGEFEPPLAASVGTGRESYPVPNPAALWGGIPPGRLSSDGGRRRPARPANESSKTGA